MKVDDDMQDIPSDCYYLKEFQSYFLTSNTFYNYLQELKNSIIQQIISEDLYQTIQQKIIYYYSTSSYHPPKESCYDNLVRLMFTDLPPPYKYDFRLLTPNKKSFNDMIYTIRYTFGYSDRRSSGSYVTRKKIKHSLSARSSTKHGSVLSSQTSFENHSHKSIFKNRINPINESGSLLTT